MKTWTLKEDIPDSPREFDPEIQWQNLCDALHWSGTEGELEAGLEELRKKHVDMRGHVQSIL